MDKIDTFVKRKRTLPHFELPGSVYFITFRTYNFLILSDNEKDILLSNIHHYHSKLYKLYSFVIMPDHVHLLLQPLETKDNKYYSLSSILHSIKGFASKQILKLNSNIPNRRVFHTEYFDRIMRNELEYNEKLIYVLNNPVKKGLVENGFDYKWFYINDNL